MICVIPVRGGSKGVPGKNLRTTSSGKTLLAQAIEKARAVCGNRVTVLADTDELAQHAERAGAWDVWRDGRNTPDFEDVSVRLAAWKRERPVNPGGIVVLLQCTSPNVSRETLAQFVDAARRLNSGEALLAVSPLNKKPNALFEIGGDGSLRPLNPIAPAVTFPRQALPPAWWFCGALSAFYKDAIDRGKPSVFSGLKLIPFFIPEHEASDIDREEDFPNGENN
ncbi:MAG: hypothetical protein J6L64_02730 [Opitutales bacterium]|nr:hypothetical protein [Opitutales bacterium]